MKPFMDHEDLILADVENDNTPLYLSKITCSRLEKQNNDLTLMLHSLEVTARGLAQLATVEPDHPSEVIVLDIETTGLSWIEAEILQISIISGTGETLYNSYLRPLHHMAWPEAEKINKITPSMVADAPNIYHEMPKINGILKHAKTIIGYNHAGFDLPFLKQFGAVVPDAAEINDVMLEFAPIYGEWDNVHDDYRWKSLIDCAAYYGYDQGEDAAHNSLSDCRATLHCYHAIHQSE